MIASEDASDSLSFHTTGPEMPGIILCRLLTLTDTITRVRAALAEGQMPNLEGIFEELRTLCNAATTLPPAETQDLHTAFECLYSDLGILAEEMKTFVNKHSFSDPLSPKPAPDTLYAPVSPPPKTDEKA